MGDLSDCEACRWDPRFLTLYCATHQPLKVPQGSFLAMRLVSQDAFQPVIGVLENMAYLADATTGVRHELFGPSHAKDVCRLACAPPTGAAADRPQNSGAG